MCVSGESIPSTYPPSARAPGRTQTICNVQLRSGNSSIRSFKRWRGCGQAAGNGALSAQESWPSKPPWRPGLRLLQPWGTPRRAPGSHSRSARRTAVPLSQLRRRRRRSPAATAHLLPSFVRRRVPRLPAATGRRHRDPPPSLRARPEPHLRGSRRRRRTRSCRPGPRTWARGSWACGAPAARRCLLQPSSCCRCRPACRTGRPGAAWPRRAPEPSRAEPSRSAGAARGGGGLRGDGSRAGPGGESGPRGGSGHPGLGRAGAGGGTLLFLIQWRIAGPAAASGGAPGSASRSAPGRGRWRGALRRAGLGGGGRRASPPRAAPGAGGASGRAAGPPPRCLRSSIARLRRGDSEAANTKSRTGGFKHQT